MQILLGKKKGIWTLPASACFLHLPYSHFGLVLLIFCLSFAWVLGCPLLFSANSLPVPLPWQVNLDLTSLLDGEDKKSKNKRGVLPKHATNIMRSWLFQHLMVSTVAAKTPCKGGKKRQKNPKMNKSRWWFVWIYIQRSQSGFGFILGMTVFTAAGKNTPLMHEEANRGGLPQIIVDGWCSIFFQLIAPKYCFPASLGVKAAPQVWLWHISNQPKYRITKSPHFGGWRCR